LRYDVRAIQDLRDIRAYLATHASPTVAAKVRSHLQARANRLCAHPFLGVVSSNPDIRVLPATARFSPTRS